MRPAHVGEGSDLDHALLRQPGRVLSPEQLVQGVIERSKIRKDLLPQVPGKEAERLASLHRRPRQDEPLDLVALERRYRGRHGQIGLSRAGRPYPENDGMLEHRLQVEFLAEGLRDDPPARRHDDERLLEQRLQLAALAAGKRIEEQSDG